MTITGVPVIGSIPAATLAGIDGRLSQVEGRPYGNVLPNSDFELWPPGGAEPLAWNMFWSGGTRTGSQDTTERYRGTSSWKQVFGADGAFSRLQSDEFRVSPGDVLQGRVRWRASHIGCKADIFIQTNGDAGGAQFFETGAAQQGSSQIAPSAVNVWDELVYTFVIPAGHYKCRFVTELVAPAAAAANMWADSASLVPYGAGPVDDTGWIALPLGAMANYSAGWETAAYRRKNGFVQFRGLITGSATGLMTTLPAGFRPGSDKIFWCPATAGTMRFDIIANGNCVLGGFASGGSGGYISLAQISYIAEA